MLEMFFVAIVRNNSLCLRSDCFEGGLCSTDIGCHRYVKNVAFYHFEACLSINLNQVMQ